MCNAFAISSNLIRLSEYTRSRTLLHISSSVASEGRQYKHILLHRYIRQWGRATSSTNISYGPPPYRVLLQQYTYRHMIIADYREII